MADEVLSQAELETLLASVASNVQPAASAKRAVAMPSLASAAAAPQPVKPRERVQPYDFKRPQRVDKEQLRALQMLHERFARVWGGTVGLVAQRRRSESDLGRSAQLQRVRLRARQPDLFQPGASQSAQRTAGARRAPVDSLSDHRSPAGRRARADDDCAAAAHADRAAAGGAHHRLAVARTAPGLARRARPRAVGRVAWRATRSWRRSRWRTTSWW